MNAMKWLGLCGLVVSGCVVPAGEGSVSEVAEAGLDRQYCETTSLSAFNGCVTSCGTAARFNVDRHGDCLNTADAEFRSSFADMACERITAGVTRALEGTRPIKALLDPYNPTGSTNTAPSCNARISPISPPAGIAWRSLTAETRRPG